LASEANHLSDLSRPGEEICACSFVIFVQVVVATHFSQLLYRVIPSHPDVRIDIGKPSSALDAQSGGIFSTIIKDGVPCTGGNTVWQAMRLASGLRSDLIVKLCAAATAESYF
jgi:hypothetical protein